MKTLLRGFAVWCGVMVVSVALGQPYQPHAIWSREGAGDSSLYGNQILALGDQNGDGFNDWAVVAFGWGPPGQASEPKVEFFHGGNPPDTIPYMVRTTIAPQEEYLRGAEALGDLNGDGYVEWAIIVELTNDSLDRNVYEIYFGGPGSHDTPDLILTAPWFSTYHGIGDFNGDGYDDLLLMDGVDNRADILVGGNPMDTIADWTHRPMLRVMGYGDLNHDGFSDFVSEVSPSLGPQVFLGGSVPDTAAAYTFTALYSGVTAIVRDVNGDGYADLAYSESGWGRLCWGGLVLDTVANAHLDFPCSGSGPLDIVSAGDFNHDGFGDVVMIHEWCENNYYGVLTFYLGGPQVGPEPTFVLEGWTAPLNLIHFKTAVNLGDVNGDHVDDLAIGANGDAEYAAWRGKVVILGGDDSLRAEVNPRFVPQPSSLSLSVYPNPFNAVTTISFAVPHAGGVGVQVFDLTGRLVKTLWDGRKEAGEETIGFEGKGLSSGVYLVRVQTRGAVRVGKVTLLK